LEVASHVGDPDLAMGAVVDPSAVRSQLIVKDIESDSPLGIIILVVVSLTIVVVSSLCVYALGSVARGQHQCDGCENEMGS
jgi:hypothetical protein